MDDLRTNDSQNSEDNKEYRKSIYTSQFNSFALSGSLPKKVLIFDTTLRDGEQTPGIALSIEDKVKIASALSDLGVDVIEAGFPITSAGEREAIKKIAALKLERSGMRPGPIYQGRHRFGTGLRARLRAHLHRHIRHPPEAQAQDDPGAGAGQGGGDGRVCQVPRSDRGDVMRGRDQDGPGFPQADAHRRAGGRRGQDQPAGHRRHDVPVGHGIPGVAR